MKKVPEITLLFWVMKICATTLGETAGDLLAQTLNVGYAVSSLLLIGIFGITLIAQLKAKKYIPVLYWSVILATSTAGTTMSDYMDRTLGLGYATGSSILVTILVIILAVWYRREGTLSVTDIKTTRPELFYWTAILFSNTLGTALGDFLADDSGLGFGGGALLIGSLIGRVILCHYFTEISSVILFWIAFVLTRPFGATFGDLLTKSTEKGGLGFGTQGSSLILFGILVGLILYTSSQKKKQYMA
ncbi:COG4705 family protein [Spirosoma pollinicola]|uniref:Membrane-anchored protein n=1 Tax=Spirosoma pollinicola TaxID=2057025 RepID=A0A2K8Z688_9BACT|nr:hypothetical protein [Spirosoma pollinicola]AUD05392.1 hypothetical protein CWM47_28185 [Spirosoma pollinicola]